MKFTLPIFVSIIVFSFSLNIKRHKEKSKRNHQITRPYAEVLQDYKEAARVADGAYLDFSWNQGTIMNENIPELREQFAILQQNPKFAKFMIKDSRNLTDLREHLDGICAGMSMVFLRMLKAAKESGPPGQANERAEAEILRMGTRQFKTDFYIQALQLHNFYIDLNNIKSAAISIGLQDGSQQISIPRGSTSTVGTTTRDVDLETQGKSIHDWFKAHHTSHSYILFMTKTHAMAYARVSENLKYFFDPNFGVIRFTSISRFDRFFERFFGLADVKRHYTPRMNTEISLMAFS